MNILEQSLWVKIREGDMRSFELLFNSYYKGLHLYACDIIRNGEDAEEIIQDVFYALWDKRQSINIHSSLKAYLYRSVHNQCINFIRNAGNVSKKNMEYINETSIVAYQKAFVNEEFALDHMVASELEKTIEEAINSLPHQCREVFYLSRYEQLKIREIAEKLSISESTVKTQMVRALDKLRDLLKNHLN